MQPSERRTAIADQAQTRFVQTTSDEAYALLLADAAERSADADKWTTADAEALNASVRRELGEGIDLRRWLFTRADRFWEAYAAAEETTEAALRRKLEKRFRPIALHSGSWTLLLAAAAYLAGALLDRWSADGRIINLLSPPILGLLLWNAAVYVWILLSTLWPKRSNAPFGIRRLLAALMTKSTQVRLRQAQRDFAAKMLQLAGPEIAAAAGRALHLAAAAFAVGMMASIAVRGIGTAYTVGWESTWLAGRPDLVASVLQALLGWMPERFCGSVDFSAASLAAMNLTAGGSAADAAPWILRLVGLLFAAAVAPRLLLASLCAWRIRQARRRMRFPLSMLRAAVPEFAEAAPAQCTDAEAASSASAAESTVVYADASISDDASNSALERLKKGLSEDDRSNCWAAAQIIPINVWDEAAPSQILCTPKQRRLALWIDAASTPEDEVHGAVLDALAEASLTTPVVLLDAASLAARFGAASDNVKARIQLWTRFAQVHRADLTAVGSDASVKG